jgi:hypothetical protein
VSAITTATLFREPPPTASGQRQRILCLLREAARSGQGMNTDTLGDLGIKMPATRVWEPKNWYGFRIETCQDRVTRMATHYFRGDPPEGWHLPSKQARLRLEAGAEPASAAREAELAHFEKTHRADLEREAPLFAERRP